MDAEKYLALAVQEKLRTALSLPSNQRSIQVEMSEDLPAMSFETMVSVIPNGVSAGDLNGPGLSDLMLSIGVFPVIRARAVPRDVRRNIYLEVTKGLADLVQVIVDAVDGNALFTELAAVGADVCQFVEPLRLTSLENRPKIVYPADFGSKETSPAGYGRLVKFG